MWVRIWDSAEYKSRVWISLLWPSPFYCTCYISCYISIPLSNHESAKWKRMQSRVRISLLPLYCTCNISCYISYYIFCHISIAIQIMKQSRVWISLLPAAPSLPLPKWTQWGGAPPQMLILLVRFLVIFLVRFLVIFVPFCLSIFLPAIYVIQYNSCGCINMLEI